MEYLQYIGNIILGITIATIYGMRMYIRKLKVDKRELKKSVSIDIDEYEKLISEHEKLKEDYSDIIKERDKLKVYIGVVNEKEFGILSHTLIRTLEDGTEKKVHFDFEFKVVKRGQEKVKIEITDYKSSSEDKRESLFKRCQSIVNGWYDINDPEITWIEPDKAVQRDFKIDDILSE